MYLPFPLSAECVRPQSAGGIRKSVSFSRATLPDVSPGCLLEPQGSGSDLSGHGHWRVITASPTPKASSIFGAPCRWSRTVVAVPADAPFLLRGPAPHLDTADGPGCIIGSL